MLAKPFPRKFNNVVWESCGIRCHKIFTRILRQAIFDKELEAVGFNLSAGPLDYRLIHPFICNFLACA
jgi:hypothetical protein